MAYLLIPHGVTAETATLWVGAVDEDVSGKRVEIVSSAGTVEVPGDRWQEWESRYLFGKKTLRHQRVTLGSAARPLEPRRTYPLQLHVDGAKVADASVTTLPLRLPTRAEPPPFTVFLGSCFYRDADKEGKVGKAFHDLYKTGERPDLKILCGDQVYLDNPPVSPTIIPHTPPYLKWSFFEKYVNNWTQALGPDAGFQQLLKNGANYFCSDDHEFWNNAPDIGGVGFFNTVLGSQRDWWFRTAGDLFRRFQSEEPFVTFDVPPLSFCVADTRINRRPKLAQFMEQADLDAIGAWIRKLKGPGVLVLGQLVLSKKVDKLTGKLDLGLPDYEEQYKQLVAHIRSAEHSIILLTGDVHFGRVSSGLLRPDLGTHIVEVISSPMQQVKGAPGKFEDAPQVFSNLKTFTDFARGQNHFQTIEFTAAGGSSVAMKVKFWPIRAGQRPASTVVFSETLR